MCTVVRVFPSSSRNRWNAIIRGSFVSTKSTSSARFLRASSSFPGLIFAVPTYTNAPDIASSLLSPAALPSDGAGAAAHSRAGPFDEILNRTANASLKAGGSGAPPQSGTVAPPPRRAHGLPHLGIDRGTGQDPARRAAGGSWPRPPGPADPSRPRSGRRRADHRRPVGRGGPSDAAHGPAGAGVAPP